MPVGRDGLEKGASNPPVSNKIPGNRKWNNSVDILQVCLYYFVMLKKQEAEKRLGPHIQKLQRCLNGGWKAWHEHYSHRHHRLDARARAAIVYCEIVELAKELFQNVK